MFYLYKITVLLSFFLICGDNLKAQETTGVSAFFHVEDAGGLFQRKQPKYETRAVWLTTLNGLDWPRTLATDAAGIERQKAELCHILDAYQRIHINTVLLQTRIRGSVIYPSAVEPWDECLTGTPGKHPGYDPLQFCIEECHRRGMELHAWLVCIPLGKTAKQRGYGAASIVKRKPRLCKTVKGEVFMVPGQPETADYIAALCREIVEGYDVDGISLDYIRYPESTYKFSDDDLCQTKSHLPDWRRENITRIVRAVHDTVKPLKPWVKLSSSPIGKYGNLSRYTSGGWNGYNAVCQDPQLWLKENLQDMLFPMMYFQGNHFYPFLFDWLEHSYGHPVVPGLGIYFLDPREGRWALNIVRAEMHTARNSGIGGMAFYRSAFLTRNVQGLYDCLAEEFFPYPALPPRMTWMQPSCPLPAPPVHVHYLDGQLHWQGEAPFYNIYGSNRWPVDCTKAENLLAIHVPGCTYELSGRAQKVRYYAVTACDRFGGESSAVQDTAEERPQVNRPRVSYLINRDLKGQKKSAGRKKSKKNSGVR